LRDKGLGLLTPCPSSLSPCPLPSPCSAVRRRIYWAPTSGGAAGRVPVLSAAPGRNGAMAVRAYVLIETAVGKTREVKQALMNADMANAKVLAVDAVTGPYDLIAQVEGVDLDALGTGVAQGVQSTAGITRTLTCLVVSLG